MIVELMSCAVCPDSTDSTTVASAGAAVSITYQQMRRCPFELIDKLHLSCAATVWSRHTELLAALSFDSEEDTAAFTFWFLTRMSVEDTTGMTYSPVDGEVRAPKNTEHGFAVHNKAEGNGILVVSEKPFRAVNGVQSPEPIRAAFKATCSKHKMLIMCAWCTCAHVCMHVLYI